MSLSSGEFEKERADDPHHKHEPHTTSGGAGQPQAAPLEIFDQRIRAVGVFPAFFQRLGRIVS
jgi:hypothetical protein